jgi:hypothetical protein
VRSCCSFFGEALSVKAVGQDRLDTSIGQLCRSRPRVPPTREPEGSLLGVNDFVVWVERTTVSRGSERDPLRPIYYLASL